MRDGLRSNSKLLAEANNGAGSLHKRTFEVEEAELGPDCSDDNVTELSGSRAEKVEMEESDESKPEESGAGSDVGGVEFAGNRKKRSRIVAEGGESEEDGVEMAKLKVVGRILRSMSAVKSERMGDVGRKNVDGDSIGKRTRARVGSEDKSFHVQRKSIDGDCIGQRTRGRVGFQGKSVDVIVSQSKEDVRKKNVDGCSIGRRTRGGGGSENKSIDRVTSESNEVDQTKNIDDNSTGKNTSENGGPEDKSADVVIREIKEEVHIDADCIGKRTRGRGGPEDNILNVVKVEVNQSDDEHHPMPETIEKNKVLGKRGRPKSQECQELQEKRADVEGEIDQTSDEESHQLNNNSSKKSSCKRGRPHKTEESNDSEEDMADVQKEVVTQVATPQVHQPHNKMRKKFKRKRGRPRKASEGNEFENKREVVKKDKATKLLKPRRGRPPKAQNSVLSEKKISEVEKGEVDQFDGRQSDHQNNEMKEKRKPKLGRPFKMNKGKQGNVGNECDMKLPEVKKMKCQKVEMEGSEGKKKAGETGRRLGRQAVRDKIMELVLGAGWEIQYRPRHGRVYNDAVYVNPQGRTHWSITLAYRVLKQQFEDGTFDSKACKSGFKFIPIPEEELRVLNKVMGKERCDKNKKKKKWNEEEEGEPVIGETRKRKLKLQKRKLGHAAGLHHKMLKGRPKLKSLQNKKGISGGTAVSVRGRKPSETHGRKRCGLMVRNSQDGTESDSDRYFLYNGKRTVLTWMIDLGTLALDGKVDYFNSRKMRAPLKGRIKTGGVQCDCCSETYTIEEFEAHAGGKSCQPFENIFLETGSSLLQCQLDSWNKQDEPSKKGFHFIDINHEDPNDDTCGICGDGGDLICCDGCPSTFHKSCLEIKKFPSGPWHCIYCVCKFCGEVGGNGCQENDNAAPPSELHTCFLCEEKYHQSCVKVNDVINEDPDNPSFCGEKCQKLNERLQMLLGVKHEMEEGFSWTLVRRFNVGSDSSLSGMARKVDCNSKVAIALHIMDECFMPMVDHRSGVNLIRNIVYNFGSNFNRLNYAGFFTAILERGDEMIAAASIRIHGNQLAEMPFIGTRYMYRRQGMCRRLLTAIETALCSLNVEKLVIPAISELRGTWSSVFGFKPFEESSKKILRNLNLLVFPGVDMLQKSVSDSQFTEQTVHPKEGLQSTEHVELLTMEKKTDKSERYLGFDLNDPGETGLPYLGNEVSKIDAVTPGSLVDGCLNDTSDTTIQNANTKQCCSDILDGSNVNIMSCQDSLCDDAHQQTGNEKINDLNQRCSGGSNLEVFSETDVARGDKPAAVQSVSVLPDGCLNETLDMRIEDDASNTMCQDQSCGVSSKFCKVPHLGSEAAISIDSSKTIFCNVKTGDEYSPNSSGQNYVDSTSEVRALQSCDLFVENGTTGSCSNSALCDSKITTVSSGAGESLSPEAHQRTQLLPGSSAALVITQNLNCVSESKGPDSQEKGSTLARANLVSDDQSDITRSDLLSSGNVHDSKDVYSTAQNENEAPSTVGCLISNTELTATDSDRPGNAINLMQCNSESSSSLRSTSVYDALEAITLLNQTN
ncbi:Acyl-CoA N-acyltransferase with RING/FYVE/PHD-type zinc finger protein [Euphorbia peplus]|nr:Acyl-CoA N-acyltransferase with RING/FYVE/PHD-type zinc finger protein [Euphorbia peplus]